MGELLIVLGIIWLILQILPLVILLGIMIIWPIVSIIISLIEKK